MNNEQSVLQKDIAMAQAIAHRVAELGGHVYYVGGFVRDRLLNKSNKDVDIEVHGILPVQLNAILDDLGQRLEYGRSFAIQSLQGYHLDVAMPRRERSTGPLHDDFDVTIDPFMGTYRSAMRRDFTVNALMQDVLTGEVIDHFGGIDDLHRGILRHVSDETFAEDPLRVLRAAQFAARFAMQPAPETLALCAVIPLDKLSGERVFEEMRKALMQAQRPSRFFEILADCHQLSHWFFALQDLIGTPQNPDYHAEGDVWNHTMLVLDHAAAYRDDAVNYPLGFMLAALLHDIGKPAVTRTEKGKIIAWQHESVGVELAKQQLRRLATERKLISYVSNMVELHMMPSMLAENNSSVKACNHLFDRSADPNDLIYLAQCDRLGQIRRRPAGDALPWLQDKLQRYQKIMALPYVQGKDLVVAGVTPDPLFTQALKYAHKLRLAGVNKDSALRQTLAYLKQLQRQNAPKD